MSRGAVVPAFRAGPRTVDQPEFARRLQGFTLVEMLVALAILSVIMLLLVTMTNNVSKMWRYSSSKIETFREARDAFEVMTRRISQATLGTYWGYNPPLTYGETPTSYQRLSNLQFVTGTTPSLLTTSPQTSRPGTAMFFFAPLGYDTTYTTLSTLLNMCGYYVEFNSDATLRPSYVTTPLHYRYRLMQVLQPSSSLSIYKDTSGPNGFTYDGFDWFQNALTTNPPPTGIMAENIIALTLIPHLSQEDLAAEAAAGQAAPAATYTYDSRNTGSSTTLNQLPPLVDVTMVAIDEVSANRLSNGVTEPGYGTDADKLFQSAANNAADLATLEAELTNLKVTFQVFTTTVPILEAKWSIR